MFDNTTEIIIELFLRYLEKEKIVLMQVYTGNVNANEVLKKYLKEKNL